MLKDWTKIFSFIIFMLLCLPLLTSKALSVPILVNFSVTNIKAGQSEQEMKLIDSCQYKSIEDESKTQKIVTSWTAMTADEQSFPVLVWLKLNFTFAWVEREKGLEWACPRLSSSVNINHQWCLNWNVMVVTSEVQEEGNVVVILSEYHTAFNLCRTIFNFDFLG